MDRCRNDTNPSRTKNLREAEITAALIHFPGVSGNMPMICSSALMSLEFGIELCLSEGL